ncbi:winged helix-turn-helix domain-containing protein [Okibacterium endophyticum]
MTDRISLALARRIALAAQGFGSLTTRTPSPMGVRQLNSLVERLGVLQIDSVNVFERSHYLPVFARLGEYDKALLDRVTMRPRARHLEYWAHEAAFLPRARWPLFRWRMNEYRDRSLAAEDGWAAQHRAFLQWLRDELRDRGPMAASEVEHDSQGRTGPWWGWSDVKIGLETLFRWGEVVSAGRSGFERRYGLAEHLLTADELNHEIGRDDAIRELVRHAAIAHGVATLDDLADYYRLRSDDTRRAVAELTDAGELIPVSVDGWEQSGRSKPAWLHAQARRPRSMDVDALLSPFDPVVWARPRALRLFDLHYRIEIYTPKHKRVHGYYVLPVLIGGRIAARVDLKNDRQADVLRVQSAWAEPGAPDDTADRLAGLLRRTARWQQRSDIQLMGPGNLSSRLAAALNH